MILDLQFKNYRSFRDECNFTMEASSSETKPDNVFTTSISENSSERLLKIAVIYGANASGKTNIIRLLYSLRAAISKPSETKGGEGVSIYDPFRLDGQSSDKPTEVSLSFIIDGIKYVYSLEYDQEEFISEKLIYYPKGVAAILFERELIEGQSNGLKNYKAKYGSTISKTNKQKFSVFSNKLIISKFLYDVPDDLITPVAKYLSNIHIANGYHSRMISDLWDEVRDWLSEDPKRKQKLVELLAFADLGIKTFKVATGEKLLNKVTLVHERYNAEERIEDIDFHFENESYGTRQLFVLGGKILQSLESGIPLLVDEMDTGFHTYISSFILDVYRNKRINKNNAQLILTTHDINLLNEDCLRRDQVWFTEKSDKGVSELYSLSDFEGVREDTAFAKWYMANKFGAVPTIRSLEKLFVDETD
ncbi:MAG: ATP-binding protein [Bacteroidetes bacterium]|jgi:AAA15 family ATPase/GTPase|nr:ATP-binding protein [Bacteroidota bacterium]